MQLYAAGYLAILVFQKVFHYFLPAPSHFSSESGDKKSKNMA